MKPDVLELHGTTAGGLTPGAIVTAAEVDIRRRQRNMDTPRHAGAYEAYAFHRRHVSKSASPGALLEAAIKDRDRGIDSGKKSTRLIYRDEALLRQALQIVNGS